jgi:hypothetical protein
MRLLLISEFSNLELESLPNKNSTGCLNNLLCSLSLDFCYAQMFFEFLRCFKFLGCRDDFIIYFDFVISFAKMLHFFSCNFWISYLSWTFDLNYFFYWVNLNSTKYLNHLLNFLLDCPQNHYCFIIKKLIYRIIITFSIFVHFFKTQIPKSNQNHFPIIKLTITHLFIN